MSEHFCQGSVHRPGHILTSRGNCEACGEPLCGKPARFDIRLEDRDGTVTEIVRLCADHYDEFLDWLHQGRFFWVANWHECPSSAALAEPR